MAWKSQRDDRYNWREWLTEDERRQIDSVEAEMAAVKKRHRELAAIRRPIQNRAINRAKYRLAHSN